MNKFNDYSASPSVPNGRGVVIIHEFWGVNGQIKKMADKFAAEGYTAVAVDLYEGKHTDNADEAKQMKEGVKEESGLERIREAMTTLNESGIKDKNIAVCGFCFGGSYAFKSAVADLGAGAYVIYYGSMITDNNETLKKILKPVFGVFGGSDKGIPTEKVLSMKKNLDDLGKINEVYIYPEAGHAFANDKRPSFNKEASIDAWNKTMLFLKKYL